MNDASTSLDRLHDLVSPPAVSWWAPAPGWYVVLGVSLVLFLLFVYKTWRRWEADVYRRAALRELESLNDASTMAELLRRTALAITPREIVAGKTGNEWLDWLATRCPEPMPDAVRSLITAGVYGHPPTQEGLATLRQYIRHWIELHEAPQGPRNSPIC